MDRIVCLPHADALVALRRDFPHRVVHRLLHRHRTKLACGQGKAGGDDNEVMENELFCTFHPHSGKNMFKSILLLGGNTIFAKKIIV